MPLEHHPLIKEFPKFKDKLHQLKMDDEQYRKLVHEYEGLDRSIYRAESEMEVTSDDHLEELKKERLALKDMILKMLKEN